jgi:hypothetical protein
MIAITIIIIKMIVVVGNHKDQDMYVNVSFVLQYLWF